jgi:uncharacterized PurR-regulated membrane protein YhhQ (DUF165 family)
MKVVVVVIVLAAAAAVATYVHYRSLSPCDWMEQDMAERSGSPPIVVRASIRANFLLEGIADPGAYDCLLGWWRFKSEAPPANP